MRIYAKIHKLIDIKKEMGKKDYKQAVTKGSQPKRGNAAPRVGFATTRLSHLSCRTQARSALTPSLPAPLGADIFHLPTSGCHHEPHRRFPPCDTPHCSAYTHPRQ